MGSRVGLDLGHEAHTALLLLGGDAHELDLLLGGKAVAVEDGVVGGRLLVDDDGGVRNVEVLVGEVGAGGGLAAEEGGSVGPGGECAGVVQAEGVGEGALARSDVEHVVWGGRRWRW